VLHKKRATGEKVFDVSLTTGHALPDTEDVPSENTSLLVLLQFPFDTPEPEGEQISDDPGA
jgi:hypothetical protein